MPVTMTGNVPWSLIARQLPRILVFAFGAAFCAMVLSSLALLVASGGERFLTPSTARLVFGPSFVVALGVLVALAVRKNRSNT